MAYDLSRRTFLGCAVGGLAQVNVTTAAWSKPHQAVVAHPTVSPRREGRAAAVDLAPVIFSLDTVLSDGTQGAPS